MLWVRRTLAFFLIGLGCALLFLHLPAVVTGVRDCEILTMTVEIPPYSIDTAREAFGDFVLDLSSENLKDVPEIHQAILHQWSHSGSVCVSMAAWKKFEKTRKINHQQEIVHTFRDAIQRLTDFKTTDDPSDGKMMCWAATYIGAYDDQESDRIDHLEERVFGTASRNRWIDDVRGLRLTGDEPGNRLDGAIGVLAVL